VPEHDIDTGEVVGERPRWKAIAPYVGIPIATAGIFGLEAYAPAIAAWLGLGGDAAEVGAVTARAANIIANAERGAASQARVLRELGLARNTQPVVTAEGRSIPDALTDTMSVEIKDSAYVSASRQLDSSWGRRNFRKAINIDYWNENEAKSQSVGLVQ
jgi:hypothetical protein